MAKKNTENDKIILVGYGFSEKDTAFLNRLHRLFSDFGFSVSMRKYPFLIVDDVEYRVTLTLDEKKYRERIGSTGRKKTVVLSAEMIRRRMEKGETADRIAADLGVGRATLFRHLKKAES